MLRLRQWFALRRLPADVRRLRGWNIRDAERELRRTRERKEAVRLISQHKHALGLTHER